MFTSAGKKRFWATKVKPSLNVKFELGASFQTQRVEVQRQINLNRKSTHTALSHKATDLFGVFFFSRLTDRITPQLLFLQEHPVVITKFIRGAREVEVDAVAKRGRVRHD